VLASALIRRSIPPGRYKILIFDVRCPLFVECSLVLQPLSVASHTRDLFAIVIRYRVGHTASTWIYSVRLNPPVEFLLLLVHLIPELSIPPVEGSCANDGSSQPTKATAGECNQAQSDERIERNLRDKRIHVRASEHLSTEHEPTNACANTRAQLKPSSCFAELEECVPV